MLNSCAAGISVVNIDNGFSAAVTATLINKKIEASNKNADNNNYPETEAESG